LEFIDPASSKLPTAEIVARLTIAFETDQTGTGRVCLHCWHADPEKEAWRCCQCPGTILSEDLPAIVGGKRRTLPSKAAPLKVDGDSLTVTEAARLMKIPRPTLAQWIRLGKVRAFRGPDNNRLRVLREDVDRRFSRSFKRGRTNHPETMNANNFGAGPVPNAGDVGQRSKHVSGTDGAIGHTGG
jgi:excisionase family DNA binding protein